ncbi:ParA family protein [Methylibium petroleiphilum]|uniref:Putative partition-related protein n=1 Tax=Methylibium petroleiphilum (strain ATCC BAA-1232 / LMG 22953 / PM1) TaxID=420662 RepID=A2SEX5_METPP|nr:ParA family protein [Methylibium petroleiphilum]ABM94114.1 putative partition-related protein [Methylibium petroleiphilum PM1]
MPVIVVANPKGGVGKSTLSTNLAGYLARQGHAVMLGDVDRQQSARTWLGLRSAALPEITGWELQPDHLVKPPKGTSHVVLDTPAGLHGKKLDEVMRIADRVLVPLQPSIFDIYATRDFITQLLARRKSERVDVAVIANRVRDGSISAGQLDSFLGTLGVPLLGHLRDTQNYIHLAARGLTLWDVAPSRVEKDLEQWTPLTRWAEGR